MQSQNDPRPLLANTQEAGERGPPNGLGMETEAGGHVRKHLDKASSVKAVVKLV